MGFWKKTTVSPVALFAVGLLFLGIPTGSSPKESNTQSGRSQPSMSASSEKVRSAQQLLADAECVLGLDRTLQMRTLEKAKKIVNRIDPNLLPATERLRLYYLLGRCAELQRNWKEAEEDYRLAYQVNRWGLLPVALDNLKWKSAHNLANLQPEYITAQQRNEAYLLGMHLLALAQITEARKIFLPLLNDKIFWDIDLCLMRCAEYELDGDQARYYGFRFLSNPAVQPVLKKATKTELCNFLIALPALTTRHTRPLSYWIDIFSLDPADAQLGVIIAALRGILSAEITVAPSVEQNILSKIARFSPKSPSTKAQILYFRALSAQHQGQQSKALQYALRAVSSYQASYTDLQWTARLAMTNNAIPEVDRLYKAAICAAPTDTALAYSADYIHWLREQQRCDDALALCDYWINVRCVTGKDRLHILKEKFLVLKDAGLLASSPETNQSRSGKDEAADDNIVFSAICSKDPGHYIVSLPAALRPSLQRRINSLTKEIEKGGEMERDPYLLQRAELYLILRKTNECLSDLSSISQHTKATSARWHILKFSALNKLPSTQAIESEKLLLLSKLPVN